MRRPYAWAKVERGDIISFRYKSKQGGTSTKRLFLVLEPKLKNQAKKIMHAVFRLRKMLSNPLKKLLQAVLKLKVHDLINLINIKM